MQQIDKSSDFRRNVRPLFLDPVSQKPLPSKKYYDLASWLATQTTFSFAAAPFIILGFNESLQVWSRVNFYGVISVFASLAFFASPAKGYLRKMLEKKSREAGGHLSRSTSSDNLKEPVLGLSADPGQDIDEAIHEFQAEVERVKKDMDKQKNSQKKEL